MCQERLQRVRALQAELLSEANNRIDASPQDQIAPSKGLNLFQFFVMCVDFFLSTC